MWDRVSGDLLGGSSTMTPAVGSVALSGEGQKGENVLCLLFCLRES